MNSLLQSTDEYRPLLRLESVESIKAKEIKRGGFSGVILPAKIASKETLGFARACRDLDLEFWLNLSRLPAPNENLRRQRLVFEKNQPRFLTLDSGTSENWLDTLHPQSGAVATAILDSFARENSLLSGVVFQPKEEARSTPFPQFPWSPDLPESFLARHNFNILHRVETLVSSGGDEASRIRQQFWDEIDFARATHFYTPVFQWCRKHALNFRVHNFRSEWNALNLSADLQAHLIGAAIEVGNCAAFPIALEADTSCGEFSRLLRTGAFFFAQEYSAQLQSPPHIMCNEMRARAGSLFADSKSAAKVGVLFPARSAQTHYHPDGHRFTRWVGEDLQLVTDLLDSLHFEWMFVFEEQINAANRVGSTLRVGAVGHDFEMIVVPSATALSWDVWQKLEAFAEDGGKVACLGLLPRWSERGRDRALEKRIGKDSRLIIEDLYQAYDALEGNAPMPPTIGYPVFREYHSGGRLCCYQPRLNPDYEDARLRVRQILHESLSPTFETLAEKILYVHRIAESSDLFFVLNDGAEAARVNARLRPLAVATANLVATELDVNEGRQKRFCVATSYSPDEGGGIGVTFELAPGQARFIEIHSEPTSQNIERASFEMESFDGDTARGWMMQNGTAQIALRRDGRFSERIQWFAGTETTVPTPLLLDADEWSEKVLQRETVAQAEYSQSVTIPAQWKNCRVYLEVAESGNAVQALINDGDAGLKVSPPFRFDVTLLLAFGASNDFVLRIWGNMSGAAMQNPPLARLVAYPSVEVKITP